MLIFELVILKDRNILLLSFLVLVVNVILFCLVNLSVLFNKFEIICVMWVLLLKV